MLPLAVGTHTMNLPPTSLTLISPELSLSMVTLLLHLADGDVAGAVVHDFDVAGDFGDGDVARECRVLIFTSPRTSSMSMLSEVSSTSTLPVTLTTRISPELSLMIRLPLMFFSS